MARHVVIASAVRTAIGTFGGTLSGHSPTQLGALCVAEALSRAKIEGADVDHVVFGNVVVTEPKDAYLGRVAAIEGGIPIEVPAMTVNRLCGSGVQSIVSAAQSIMLGDADVAVAGGSEAMSRSPHLLHSARFGQRMGDTLVVDHLTGILTDPFGNGIMGITAENVAAKWQVSRDQQDAFAAESQRRAARAQSEGRFKDQILPVEVRKGRETIAFATDEHLKPETTPESLSGLRPVFRKDGTVTAGNASGINDGAAAVVLMEEGMAERQGRDVLARIVGYAHAGVEPGEMGIGPVPAVRNLLKRTGLNIGDFDVIESNEAFAAQACAVSSELGFDPEKTNPNGGGIALGHPVGATGTILTVKAAYELARTGGRLGLITMCIGGGQGIALAIERV
ncbi:acetyl-CoA C-acyltransferase family protein [Microvirga pudoricolor]|uniref:acetyl-CoA C-acyltransferase family protein n=1 Tax=Microvirga pudoricolor TaxID=2778729 RepID=UPI001951E77E|nr:acetyl-CoA C-acyltransferase family protein [Microvirga pudoricolor]MBM6592608.1 acetyl-CoA C-acyltransferase family protein [Microvirga pudoricolor]